MWKTQCSDENTLFLFKCYLKSFSMRLIITHMLSPCPPVSKGLFLFQASIKQFLSFGQWAYFNDRYFVIWKMSKQLISIKNKDKKKLFALKILKYSDQGNKVLFNYTRAMFFCCALCIFKMKDRNNQLFMVMNSTVHTHSRVIEIKVHSFPVKVNPF